MSTSGSYNDRESLLAPRALVQTSRYVYYRPNSRCLLYHLPLSRLAPVHPDTRGGVATRIVLSCNVRSRSSSDSFGFSLENRSPSFIDARSDSILVETDPYGPCPPSNPLTYLDPLKVSWLIGSVVDVCHCCCRGFAVQERLGAPAVIWYPNCATSKTMQRPDSCTNHMPPPAV